MFILHSNKARLTMTAVILGNWRCSVTF